MRRLATYLLILISGCVLSAQNRDDVVQSALIDAVRKYNDGDFDGSMAYLHKLQELAPDDDAVMYYLGLNEFSTGAIDSAIVHMDRAASLDSTNAWYSNGLASAYLSKGDTRKAAPLLKRLVDRHPQSFSNAYTLSILGDVSLSDYQDSLALDYYTRALEHDPDYAPAIMGKAEINRMHGNLPAFFAGFKTLVDDPNVIPGIKTSYLKALTEHMDQRFYWMWGKQMEEMVDSCISLHPEDLEARDLKITYCSIRRDTTGMLQQCDAILEHSGNDPDKKVRALSIKGDLCYTMGDMKGAYKAYEKALDINPGYAPVLNNYAYFLSCEGRKLRKAEAMSAVTVKAEPDNATYLDTYGWILFLRGKAKEAKPYFKHAIIYGGKSNGVIMKHYSQVLEALGEKDLAEYYRMLSEKK